MAPFPKVLVALFAISGLAGCAASSGPPATGDTGHASEASEAAHPSSDAATASEAGPELDEASSGDDTGGPGDAGVSDDTSDAAGECSPPGGTLGWYVTAASGDISGSDVSASFCNASAWLYQSSSTTPRDDYLLFFNSTEMTSFVATKPADASYWLIVGSMQVSAASPGVYPSAGECGGLGFEFSLPVPPGVTCSGTGPSCPPGCQSVCSSSGCAPCGPIQPTVSYIAEGASDCLGTTRSPTGSWTVTLTSVEPYYSDAGGNENGPHYVAHGTLTATVPSVGGDGGSTMALTAAF